MLLKNLWPITALCSIKKALSQRNADNFDPAVREIKGQDRCRGMQNTRFLPTALLPFLRCFFFSSLDTSFTQFYTLFVVFCLLLLPFCLPALAFVHFSVSFQNKLQWEKRRRNGGVPSFISSLFSTATCFVLPFKFALHNVIISCLSRLATLP